MQLTQNLQAPILLYARRDFVPLRQDLSVQQALDTIRVQGVGERVLYFYVLDESGRLVGIVPTRRLLTAKIDSLLANLMVTRVQAIPHTASVMEACEFFVLHRFLAFPVIDDERRLVGVVDISLFTDEVFELAEAKQTDEVFESLGFRIAQVRDASPVRAVRYRLPWLFASITSGIACAILVSVFEQTLAHSLVLTFFLALVLGLGESVSIQSLTVTIQTLRVVPPTLAWYRRALLRELATGLMLGGACGAVVAFIVLAWKQDLMASMVIGLGIAVSLVGACFFGLSVPALLHALRLDPRIAAGPLALALADLLTLFGYSTLAALLL